MKRFFTLIILCTLIYACKPGVPKGIIQPDKMEKVLIDIHIVDGYISTLNLPSQDTSIKVASPMYRGVYRKFDIDSALYNKSLDYYYKHPDLMKKMYDSIGVKINLLKDQVTKADVMYLGEFKGIFDESSKDSSQVDRTLDRRYNYRYLIKQRYGNIMEMPVFSAPSTQVPVTPNATEAKTAIDTLATPKSIPL